MTDPDLDPEPPYTEAEVLAVYDLLSQHIDHYETERERAAFVDAIIAFHMGLTHGCLPAKYMLSQADP